MVLLPDCDSPLTTDTWSPRDAIQSPPATSREKGAARHTPPGSAGVPPANGPQGPPTHRPHRQAPPPPSAPPWERRRPAGKRAAGPSTPHRPPPGTTPHHSRPHGSGGASRFPRRAPKSEACRSATRPRKGTTRRARDTLISPDGSAAATGRLEEWLERGGWRNGIDASDFGFSAGAGQRRYLPPSRKAGSRVPHHRRGQSQFESPRSRSLVKEPASTAKIGRCDAGVPVNASSCACSLFLSPQRCAATVKGPRVKAGSFLRRNKGL